ncbi:GSCOCG00012595001-RA-CDS, partial [Cotesia congregata]
KDQEFWDYIQEFDIIGLLETWVEEKEWGWWERRLPKEWVWKYEPARRENKRGRAKGGIFSGVKRGLKKDKGHERKDGAIWRKGGDWNARTGEEESIEELNEGEKTWSKDAVVNREGRNLLDWVDKREWIIMNGNKGGREGGKWTFERGEYRSVIDYGITNLESWEEIRGIKVGARIDSDHQPIIVELKE